MLGAEGSSAANGAKASLACMSIEYEMSYVPLDYCGRQWCVIFRMQRSANKAGAPSKRCHDPNNMPDPGHIDVIMCYQRLH